MSKSDNPQAVTVTLLDKEYLVACSDEERQALLDAASFLNGKMREIRDTGKIIGTERIAVMAALNIAHDFLDKAPVKQPPRESSGNNDAISQRLKGLQNKIEDALFKTRQLEL